MKNSEQLIHSFNHTPDTAGNFNGLTKREYFAGLAMQGIMANSSHAILQLTDPQKVEYSIIMADELLKQLEKTT